MRASRWSTAITTSCRRSRSPRSAAGGGSIVRSIRATARRRSARQAPAPGRARSATDSAATEPTLTDVAAILGYMDPRHVSRRHHDARLRHGRERSSQERSRGRSAWRSTRPPSASTGRRRADRRPHPQRNVERGLDPRDFVLHAFGGSGGLFAGAFAKDLGVRRSSFPLTASVNCAFGMVVVRRGRTTIRWCSRCRCRRRPSASMPSLEPMLADARSNCSRAKASRPTAWISSGRRYALPAPGASGEHARMRGPMLPFDANALARLADDFEALYERRYGTGSAYRRAGIELVALPPEGIGRDGAAGRRPEPIGGLRCPRARIAATGTIYRRRGRTTWRPAAIYDFARLAPGNMIARPDRHAHADHDDRGPERADRRTWTATATWSVEGADEQRRSRSPSRSSATGCSAIVEEAVITLKHVSGSPITNEGHDLMVSLYTADGGLLMGGVGFLHHLTSASEACKAIIRRFEGRIARGRHLSAERSLYRGAAHVRRLPRLADPFRRRAGRLVGLLRARQRHRRHESGRLLPRGARHLHRGLLVSRHCGSCRRPASGATCSTRSSTWCARPTWWRSTSAR